MTSVRAILLAVLVTTLLNNVYAAPPSLRSLEVSRHSFRA